MEVRRLIRIGERSFGVTLPREWVELHGLDVGAPIRLAISRDRITLFPPSAEGVRGAVKLEEGDMEKAVRDIIAHYIEGADEVELKTRHLSSVVTRVQEKLPGAVAMEAGGVLRLRIVTREDVDIDEAVKSMYTTADAMLSLFVEMLERDRRTLAEEILRLDDQLDRLYFFSLRTVKKNVVQRPQRYVDYVIVIKNLEHVGDAVDRATGNYLQGPSGCGEMAALWRRVHAYFQEAFQSFSEANRDKALRVLLGREPLTREAMAVPCGSAALLHEAALVIGLSADIAEAGYSRAVQG